MRMGPVAFFDMISQMLPLEEMLERKGRDSTEGA
jgi:hypothetical protein